MSDAEDNRPLKLLADTMFQAQGTGLAVYHILLELVTFVARAQPDPSGFLKGMYEAISTKLDQTPFETEKKTASAWERETLSTFFPWLRKLFVARPDDQSRSSEIPS